MIFRRLQNVMSLDTELTARALIHDRLEEARRDHLADAARAAGQPTPSIAAPVRRLAAASLRRLARQLDGQPATATASPC
jgi:hypothetical protein